MQSDHERRLELFLELFLELCHLPLGVEDIRGTLGKIRDAGVDWRALYLRALERRRVSGAEPPLPSLEQIEEEPLPPPLSAAERESATVLGTYAYYVHRPRQSGLVGAVAGMLSRGFSESLLRTLYEHMVGSDQEVGREGGPPRWEDLLARARAYLESHEALSGG